MPVQLTRREEISAHLNGVSESTLDGAFLLVGLFNNHLGSPCMVLVGDDRKMTVGPMVLYDVESLEAGPINFGGDIPTDLELGDWSVVQEYLYLVNMMNHCQGNRESAAAKAGVSIATLYRKLGLGRKLCKKHDIEVPTLVDKGED